MFWAVDLFWSTLIIHQLLNERERRGILRKLNMVIGAFFTKIGTYLLRLISAFDTNKKTVARHLVMKQDFSPEHLKKEYPYLFSLALRTNPFDPQASVELT